MLAGQENIHPNLYQNMLQAITPLLGMENTNYNAAANAGTSGETNASSLPSSSSATKIEEVEDEDEDNTTSSSSSARSAAYSSLLLNAITSRSSSKSNKDVGVAEDEDAMDDSMLDAMCKLPGGKCEIKPKKQKQEIKQEKKEADGGSAELK